MTTQTKVTYKCVSADSHVNPPPTIYADRVPAELKERAPQVAKKDGKEVLRFEGREQKFMSLAGAAGADYAKLKTESDVAQKGHAGGWDPIARIKDMDTDGVDAEVLYGSGDGGGVEMKTTDRELRFAMMQVYNDWLAEYCSPNPARLVGIAEIPFWDINLAISEATRAKKLGLRGVLLPSIPAVDNSDAGDKSYIDPVYEPLWSALEDLEMPINFHLGGKPRTRGLEQMLLVSVTVNKAMMAEPMTSLIFSGVLTNHPKLKLVSVESGIGWMAFIVDWMDHSWERHRYHTNSPLDEKPSEVWRRHIYGTFIEDYVGVRERHTIGVNRIMWSSDYPHINSTWPKSQEYIARHLEDVPEDERRMIIADNCVELYNLNS